MTAKLTLSIDQQVIESAKKASRRKGKSLSRLVEDYLRNMADGDIKKGSAVKKLSGILKNSVPADFDIKAIKTSYLKSKYGI